MKIQDSQIMIRIPSPMLRQSRKLAKKMGIPHSRLIRNLIHENIRNSGIKTS